MADFWSNLLGNLASAAIIALVAFLFRERLKRWWKGTWSPQARFGRKVGRMVRQSQHPFSWRCLVVGHRPELDPDSVAPKPASEEWTRLHPYVISYCKICGDMLRVPR